MIAEMFDLLKAALRSRPRYIIIGEIRGVEGATAFQAMQTGHPVIATFHASSIVKMIQRFTGDPINVPIRFFDNLNFAIFQEVVEAPGGGIARRITGIDEVIGYNKHSDGVLTRGMFEWDPVKDKHYFRGCSNRTCWKTRLQQWLDLPTNETSTTKCYAVRQPSSEWPIVI